MTNRCTSDLRLNSPFRLRCAKIQQSGWFSKMISSLIIFSCISLAAEGRGDQTDLAAQATEAQVRVDAVCFVYIYAGA